MNGGVYGLTVATKEKLNTEYLGSGTDATVPQRLPPHYNPIPGIGPTGMWYRGVAVRWNIWCH